MCPAPSRFEMSAPQPHQAGYSGTPLSRKLGIKAGMRILVLHAPKPYKTFFRDLPEVHFLSADKPGPVDFIHLFARTLEQLEAGLELAVSKLEKNGMLWISWPKKASDLDSEIGKFDVMEAGQGSGLVDVKVAAIDADWSGHKFVIPLNRR